MKEAGRWLWDVRTPMRDGVELSADLHLPPAGLAGGPYPVVLVRTAANNQAATSVKQARALADQGFAVAIQDVRGREDADGAFSPFRNEGDDGYDSVEWLASQEWCTGKVAMMGAGYAAWTQWAAARERPPHLSALASTSVWSPGRQHASGALSLPMLAWLHAMSARVWQEAGQVEWERVLRHLPMRAANDAIGCRLPVWHDWLDAESVASYWQDLELTATDFAAIDVPVLHLTGWRDEDQEAALRYYRGMREHSPAGAEQALVVGGDELESLHLEWFQHWLCDGATTLPPSRYHVTGADVWRDGDWCAVADGEAMWFLGGDATLSAAPPVAERVDTFRYDPADPVTVTTDFTFFPSAPRRRVEVPLDRRFIERRPDVLVYTSAELQADVFVNGCPSVVLFVSSDRVDTDWFVQLSDVAPGGASTLLATGGLRARHRAGLDREVFLEPGVVHELPVDLTGVAHVLRPGHRLRVSVTSSWFPLFDRNLNTGGRIGHEADFLVATNSVHHAPSHPSRVVLPITSQGDADV